MTSQVLNPELWLAKRLGEHSALADAEGIFAGSTTREERRERFREAIAAKGLAAIVIGRGKDRKPVTYAEAFERLYGEALEVPRETNKQQVKA